MWEKKRVSNCDCERHEVRERQRVFVERGMEVGELERMWRDEEEEEKWEEKEKKRLVTVGKIWRGGNASGG